MKLRVPRISSIIKWRSTTVLIIIILVAGFGVYWFHFRSNNNTAKQLDPTPTRTDTIQPEIKEAESALNKKDYQAAADSYLGAASDALATDPSMSESILRQATSKIPAENVPWYIYSALAQTARKLGDSALEKQSLTQAIQKAGAPGADVSADQLKGFQDRLKAIK